MEAKLAKYVLKEGHKHHGLKNGERHVFVGSDPKNNVVELTETQAKAFADKFTSQREVEARAKVAAELAASTSKPEGVDEAAELAKAKAALEADRKAFEEEKAKLAEEMEALKAKAEAEAEEEKAGTEAEANKAASTSNTTGTTKAVPPASTQNK